MTSFNLVTSELTPEVSPLLFNYESQTADLIQALSLRRPPGVSVVTVSSPYDVLAERVLLHASRLLPSLIGSDVFLFWFRLYPDSTVIAVLRQFRNFLINAWQRDSQASPNELAVLTFDDPGSLNVANLTSAIRSLLPRLRSTSVIAAVEVVESISPIDLQAIAAAFRNLTDSTLGTAVSLVFLGAAKQIGGTFVHTDAVALTLDDLPEEWRATFSRVAQPLDSTKAGTKRRRGADEILRWVLPLSALQSGVSSDIVSYIRAHMPKSDEDVGTFVRENLVVPLSAGGLSLSAAGYRLATAERQRSARMRDFDTLVSNGSRIVAFVPPENLTLNSTLEALEKYVSTNFRLIDGAAAMLTAVRSDFTMAKRKAERLTAAIKENADAFQRSNEYHHSTLIAYLSQLLMRPRYNLDYTFFQTLESLSFGFCEYLIQHVEPRNDAVYRASRLVTNIGYVYDHLPADRKRSVQVRQGLFKRAAELLGRHSPSDRHDVARYTYAEGWQLFDAGLSERAAEVFIDGAKLLASDMSDLLDAHGDPRIFDLLAIAYVMRHGDIGDDWARAELDRQVRSTGIFDSLSQVGEFLFGSIRTYEVGRRYFGARPNVVVYFCRYDFPGALRTVKDFVFRLGLIPRLHLVRPGDTIVLDSARLPHAIIGSPDTPDGIGEFISRINPMAAYLYQLKSTSDFSDLQIVTYEGRTFVSPSGAGFGDHVQWNEFWSSRYVSKESTMNDLMFGELISAMASSAGEKLTGLLINGIVDRVKSAVRQLRGTASLEPKDEADIAELRADLTQLPEAISRKGSLTTAEAVDMLRLNEKSPDVAAQVSSLLAPGGLSNIFAQIFAATDVVGSDLYQAREIMESTLKIATRVRSLRNFTLDEERWLDEYQTGVRNSLAKANQLLRRYEATNAFDDNALGELVTHFCTSTRRFATLMEDVEKRQAMRTDARGEL